MVQVGCCHVIFFLRSGCETLIFFFWDVYFYTYPVLATNRVAACMCSYTVKLHSIAIGGTVK